MNGKMRPDNLRCNYLVEPVAIDAQAPCFTWEAIDGEKGATVAACQLQVAASAAEREAVMVSGSWAGSPAQPFRRPAQTINENGRRSAHFSETEA